MFEGRFGIGCRRVGDAAAHARLLGKAEVQTGPVTVCEDLTGGISTRNLKS